MLDYVEKSLLMTLSADATSAIHHLRLNNDVTIVKGTMTQKAVTNLFTHGVIELELEGYVAVEATVKDTINHDMVQDPLNAYSDRECTSKIRGTFGLGEVKYTLDYSHIPLNQWVPTTYRCVARVKLIRYVLCV